MKKFLLFLFSIVFFLPVFSQEQLQHEKGWYVNEKGRFFVNRHLGVYLWLSFSDDQGSQKHLLQSETSKNVNPLHFDTEGYNSIRTPWEVDSNGHYVTPRKDIVFEVYADGLPPIVSTVFHGAPKYIKNGTVYYGKGLSVTKQLMCRVVCRKTRFRV